MMENDHEVPPSSSPATPIQASDVLHLEIKQRMRFIDNGKPEKVTTGCQEVDELLGGTESRGVERGVVFGISAGDEGRIVSFHTLLFSATFHIALRVCGVE
jgi:hypothetical protein